MFHSISHTDTIPAAGTIQILFFIGLIELGYAARKDDIEAAQVVPYLLLYVISFPTELSLLRVVRTQVEASQWDQETLDKKLAIELNNGRAAQMGILALMVHEKLDNNPYIINDLLGYPVPFNASPVVEVIKETINTVPPQGLDLPL